MGPGSLIVVSERRSLSRLQTILDNPFHPLDNVLNPPQERIDQKIHFTTESHRKGLLPHGQQTLQVRIDRKIPY